MNTPLVDSDSINHDLLKATAKYRAAHKYPYDHETTENIDVDDARMGFVAGYLAYALTPTTTEAGKNEGPPPPARTIVEFKDKSGIGEQALHKTARVLINGSEVLVERDSIDLDFGPNQATKLHLTLLATEVHFDNKENQ